MNIKEYKRREFIGDGLLAFIARNHICIDGTDEQNRKANWICSNEALGTVAQKLGLTVHEEDNRVAYFGKPYKPFANAVEVELYTQYCNGGLEQAKEYFLNFILPNIPNKKKNS